MQTLRLPIWSRYVVVRDNAGGTFDADDVGGSNRWAVVDLVDFETVAMYQGETESLRLAYRECIRRNQDREDES